MLYFASVDHVITAKRNNQPVRLNGKVKAGRPTGVRNATTAPCTTTVAKIENTAKATFFALVCRNTQPTAGAVSAAVKPHRPKLMSATLAPHS